PSTSSASSMSTSGAGRTTRTGCTCSWRSRCGSSGTGARPSASTERRRRVFRFSGGRMPGEDARFGAGAEAGDAMRVLLLEAPYHALYPQRDKIGFRRYFPLGIGYVAAVLRQGGFEPDLFIQPFKADFKQALAAKLEAFQPDVVGLSTMSPAYPNAVDVAR